mgnify:CR=1 FL=1
MIKKGLCFRPLAGSRDPFCLLEKICHDKVCRPFVSEGVEDEAGLPALLCNKNNRKDAKKRALQVLIFLRIIVSVHGEYLPLDKICQGEIRNVQEKMVSDSAAVCGSSYGGCGRDGTGSSDVSTGGY